MSKNFQAAAMTRVAMTNARATLSTHSIVVHLAGAALT
jgi:hypothetical protein